MIMEHDNGIEYYPELPEGYSLLTNLKELFVLKDGETKITKETAEFRKGLLLLVYNPQTNEYYPRFTAYSTNKKKLLQYFNDKNLYIKDSDLIYKKKELLF